MKVELKGNCKCLKCNWQGIVEQLIYEDDGQIIKCPSCNLALVDGLTIDSIEVDSATITN